LILGVAAVVGVLGGAQFVIDVVAGHKYAGAIVVLQVQGIAIAASFVLAGWSFALLSLKRYKGLLLANLAALVVSSALTLVLASAHGAEGAAVATVCGESVLAAGSLIALTRGHPEFRPKLGILAKVAVAGAPAVLLALLTGLPSLVRAVLALFVYAVMIVLTRAIPGEVLELLPSRARHAA
jgi:O-antigen/teichoic acid export membrane protein